MKQTLGSSSIMNSASGYELIEDLCNGQTLDPAETCTFAIKFVAATGTPSLTNAYVHLNYAIQPNQYINKIFQVEFTATEPANLAATGLSTYQTQDTGSGTGSGYTFTSYLVSYGALTTNPHINQTTYPTVAGYPLSSPTTGITITNTSILKASFLKNCPNPPACSILPPVPG